MQTMARKNLIQHWRFEDGMIRSVNYGRGSSIMQEPIPRGYYCWMFTDDQGEFMEWMEQNCPSAECTPRFNSGNPMVQVYIKEDKDATLFQLKYGST
jgi:hypothetical protein